MVFGMAAPTFAVLIADRRVRTHFADGSFTRRDGPSKLVPLANGWGASSGLVTGAAAFADAHQLRGDDPGLPALLVERYREVRAGLQGSEEFAEDRMCSTYTLIYEEVGTPRLLSVRAPEGAASRSDCAVRWPAGIEAERPGILARLQQEAGADVTALPTAIRAAARAFAAVAGLSSDVGDVLDVGLLVQQKGSVLSIGFNGTAAELAGLTDGKLYRALSPGSPAVAFNDTVVGDTWDLVRYVDGVEDAAVAVNLPVSTTVVDDEITGYAMESFGISIAVSYRAHLTPAAGGFDTRDSPALMQDWTACPP